VAQGGLAVKQKLTVVFIFAADTRGAIPAGNGKLLLSDKVTTRTIRWVLSLKRQGTPLQFWSRNKLLQLIIRWQNNTLTSYMHPTFGITQRRPKQ